jgi:hypothetical protein
MSYGDDGEGGGRERLMGVGVGLVFNGKLVFMCLFMNSYMELCSSVSISLFCIPFCYFV